MPSLLLQKSPLVFSKQADPAPMRPRRAHFLIDARLLEVWLKAPDSVSELLARLPDKEKSVLPSNSLRTLLDIQAREASLPTDEKSDGRQALLDRIFVSKQEEARRLARISSSEIQAGLATIRPHQLLRLQRFLDDATAVLGIYPTSNGTYLFVVTSHGTSATETATTASDLAGAWRDFSNEIDRFEEGRGAHDSLQAASQKLYNLVLQPVSGELEGFERVGVTGSGAARYLPLSGLYSGTSFFCDQAATFTVTDLGMLDLAEPDSDKARNVLDDVLAIANPDGTLPAAEQEVGAIVPHFHHGVTLNRERALKLTFLREAPKFGYIHLATHAVLNDHNPELSFLLFSGVTEADQQLRVPEIGKLDLSNTSLVVLSACQTGMGSAEEGEVGNGLDSLAYEFERAGARRTIASLWKVDDQATAALMSAFYDCLAGAGSTASGCLRQARLEVRKHTEWESPFYWSSFVLIGNPD